MKTRFLLRFFVKLTFYFTFRTWFLKRGPTGKNDKGGFGKVFREVSEPPSGSTPTSSGSGSTSVGPYPHRLVSDFDEKLRFLHDFSRIFFAFRVLTILVCKLIPELEFSNMMSNLYPRLTCELNDSDCGNNTKMS